MKKIIRILAVIVLISLTCTCFTGCDYVDKMREQYAYYNENKDIVYQDNIYKKLPVRQEVYFQYPSSELYVTDGEMPILLAEVMGEWCELSEDKAYVLTNDGRVFCRKDKYDSVVDRIENGFEVETYLYEYEVESTDELDFWEYYSYDTKRRIFTKEEIAAVKDVLNNVEPVTEDTQYFSDSAEYSFAVYGCSEDLLLYEESFYIIVDKRDYYIEINDEYYNSIVRKVPSKYNKLFKELTKDYVESYNAYWG